MSPSVDPAKKAELQDDVKKILLGIVVSSPTQLTVSQLRRDYRNTIGCDIPYMQLGHSRLEDFLRSIPDTVSLRGDTVLPVVSEKIAHVDSMVTKQKVTIKKPKSSAARYVIPAKRRGMSKPPRSSNGTSSTSGYSRVPPPAGSEEATYTSRNHDETPPSGRPLTYTSRNHDETPASGRPLTNGREEPAAQPVPPVVQQALYKLLVDHPEGVRLRDIDAEVCSKYPLEVYNIRGGAEELVYLLPHLARVANGLVFVASMEAQEDEDGDGDVPASQERNDPSVSSAMINNFHKILDKSPAGVWCRDLPRAYQELIGVPLNFQSLGFDSVVQMAAYLPDVFHVIRPNGNDYKLLDARRTLPTQYADCDVLNPEYEKRHVSPTKLKIPATIKQNVLNLLRAYPGGLREDEFLARYEDEYMASLCLTKMGFCSFDSFLEYLEENSLLQVVASDSDDGPLILIPPPERESVPNLNGFVPDDSAVSFPTPLSETMDLSLYPADVLGPQDDIPQQTIPTHIRKQKYVGVYVAEVINPTKFWVQLCDLGINDGINKLMDELQAFYLLHHLRYKMPKSAVRENLLCACLYESDWHRVRILKNPIEGVTEVSYIDYGTKGKKNVTELCFLVKKFISPPAQAVRCSLTNIKPAKGQTKWSPAACSRFLEMITAKRVVALISSVDDKSESFTCALVDTSDEDDFHINDNLVYEGHAEFIYPPDEEPVVEEVSRNPVPVTPTLKLQPTASPFVPSSPFALLGARNGPLVELPKPPNSQHVGTPLSLSVPHSGASSKYAEVVGKQSNVGSLPSDDVDTAWPLLSQSASRRLPAQKTQAGRPLLSQCVSATSSGRLLTENLQKPRPLLSQSVSSVTAEDTQKGQPRLEPVSETSSENLQKPRPLLPVSTTDRLLAESLRRVQRQAERVSTTNCKNLQKPRPLLPQSVSTSDRLLMESLQSAQRLSERVSTSNSTNLQKPQPLLSQSLSASDRILTENLQSAQHQSENVSTTSCENLQTPQTGRPLLSQSLSTTTENSQRGQPQTEPVSASCSERLIAEELRETLVMEKLQSLLSEPIPANQRRENSQKSTRPPPGFAAKSTSDFVPQYFDVAFSQSGFPAYRNVVQSPTTPFIPTIPFMRGPTTFPVVPNVQYPTMDLLMLQQQLFLRQQQQQQQYLASQAANLFFSPVNTFTPAQLQYVLPPAARQFERAPSPNSDPSIIQCYKGKETTKLDLNLVEDLQLVNKKTEKKGSDACAQSQPMQEEEIIIAEFLPKKMEKGDEVTHKQSQLQEEEETIVAVFPPNKMDEVVSVQPTENEEGAQQESESQDNITSAESQAVQEEVLAVGPDEPASNPSEEFEDIVFRSDSEDESDGPDVVIEEEKEIVVEEVVNSEPHYFRELCVDGKKLLLVNVKGQGFFIADQFLPLYSRFTSSFSVIKILQARGINITFPQAERKDQPELFAALKSFPGSILRKSPDQSFPNRIHLIPLQSAVSVLQGLNLTPDTSQLETEIANFNPEDVYWTGRKN